MKTFKIFFLLSLLAIFTNCTNQNEKSVIGNYKILSYELKDSLKKSLFEKNSFSLLDDKTFIFKCSDTKVIGYWKAFDDGDKTMIELIVDDKMIQGNILGKHSENIVIWNGEQFLNNNLKKISFIREDNVSD